MMSKQSAIQAKQSTLPGLTEVRSSLLNRPGTLGPHIAVQREAVSPETEATAPSLVREVVNSSGQPLDAATRSTMERRIGYDLSRVRVHTDDKAAESAKAISANAYTAGTHVAFGAGQYSPGTTSGQRLMAHELTHVVQQASGPVLSTPVGGGLSVSHPSDHFEQAARRTREGPAPAEDGGRRIDSLPSLGGGAASSSPAPTVLQLQPSQGVVDTATVVGGWSGLAAAIGGLASAGAGIASAVYAGRQAEAAEKGLVFAERQTVAAEKGLGYARQQAEAAQNPPTAPPLTGGFSVQHPPNDLPAAIPKKGPGKTPPAPKPKEPPPITDLAPVEILRVTQSGTNSGSVNAILRSDGTSIAGGYTETGNVIGYDGGSAAANANVTLRATPGVSTDDKAVVAIAFEGNNIPPRGKKIQRFRGRVELNAAGKATTKRINVSPEEANVSYAQTSEDPPLTVATLDLSGSGKGPAPTPPKDPKAAAGAGTPADTKKKDTK